MAKQQTPQRDPNYTPAMFKADRTAFAERTIDDRAAAFKRISDFIVPGWFEWHSWTNRLVDGLCNYRWLAAAGCAGACKTRNAAGYGCSWWLSAPKESSVILCSTTMKMLRKRGWAEIHNYHDSMIKSGFAPTGYGNFVDSRTLWQCAQGDDKHAIFGKAVADGDINQAAADIQGIHTKRQMIIIDEAEAVPTAIWKACANLYGYCEDVGGEFILIAMANPRSRLSQFGRFIEPLDGWESVSVESDEWLSKPQLDGQSAFVIRFDFLKSPNVVEGRTVSKHLPTKARVTSRMNALKARGGENDPDHYCYDRGFPVPEGLITTVFTETGLIKAGAFDRHEFIGTNFLIIGGFDQAFGGGDRPALRFGALGDIAGGKKGLEWLEPQIIYLDSKSSEPIRYQLMHKLQEHCAEVVYRGQKYRCDPENLAIDCTGDGGLADICQREWSPNIMRVIFSESASDEPVSGEDQRPAKDVFGNKRVEMFFQTRNGIDCGQIKGIDKDSAAELTSIEEKVEKADGSVVRRKLLQSKKEYKLKTGKSCDLADCGVILTEVARRKGFIIAPAGFTAKRDEEFAEKVRLADAVHEEESFFSPDNFEVEPVESIY